MRHRIVILAEKVAGKRGCIQPFPFQVFLCNLSVKGQTWQCSQMRHWVEIIASMMIEEENSCERSVSLDGDQRRKSSCANSVIFYFSL